MTDITFNYITRQVAIGDKTHTLTEREFRLLRELYLHGGATVEYDTLLTRVWGREYRGETKYLFDYIHLLRKKIEPDPQNPVYIINTRDRGYRLNIPAT